MSPESVQLYTIGHSNVPVERLIDLLATHTITTLCDVRSSPYSRYSSQFNREDLAEQLRSAGITYYYMGDMLGGKPQDSTLRTADGALPDYDKLAASPEFVRGLDRLIALGAQAQVACMCSEANYHTCHRNLLITPALIGRGIAVWHILPDGRLDRGAIEPQQMRMF